MEDCNCFMPRIAVLLSFGLGGHHAELTCAHRGRRATLSGYDSPESWKPREPVDKTATIWPDGTPVLDKRSILAERPGLAVASPMCDSTLPDAAERRLDDASRETARTMLPGLGGEFVPLAVMMVADKPTDEPGGFDYISVSAYVAWWAKHGARVGAIHGGKIEWDGQRPLL